MKIEKGDLTIEDTKDRLIQKGEEIHCNCENEKITMSYHIDGADFASTVYECGCGNVITVTEKVEREYME